MFDDPNILREVRRVRATQLVILRLLYRIQHQGALLMADAASILAKVTANTSVLQSIAAAATALQEGHDTIQAEIDALKAQIAAGTPPDFTALDAAADDQATVIAGISKAIPANTPVAPAP